MDLIENLVSTITISTSSSCSSLNSLDVSKQTVGLVGQVTNFSVRVKTKHLRNFSRQGLLNVLCITLPVKLLRDRTLETCSHSELHLLKNLRLDKFQEVSAVSTSIPVISDVTTVHDISEDVSEISIRNLIVTGQVVVDNLTTDSEITIVEVIVSGPALSSKLLASKNQRVEHAQSEQKCLVFLLLVLLGFVELTLLELGEGTS